MQRPDVRQRQSLENQTDRQEFDDGPRGSRDGHAISTYFHLPQHARPATQGQQRRGDVFRPRGLVDAQQPQRFVDRFQGRQFGGVNTPQFGGEAAEPWFGGTVAAAIQGSERAKVP